MKISAIKVAVAALLLAPVLSIASNVPKSATVSNLTNTVVNTLNVDVSWIDMVLKGDHNSKIEVESTKTGAAHAQNGFTYSLTGANGYVSSGSFADLVDLTNSVEHKFLSFTGLAASTYKFVVSGNWNKTDDYFTRPSLNAVASFAPVSSVPEPESYAMLLAGLGLMGTIAVRRKSNQA